jgi:hypothetical protein
LADDRSKGLPVKVSARFYAPRADATYKIIDTSAVNSLLASFRVIRPIKGCWSFFWNNLMGFEKPPSEGKEISVQ